MSNFNFDEIVPRRNTESVKWDTPEAEGVIPMWVADMDFRTAPAVSEALEKRLRHGVFGYTKVLPDYYGAVIDWFKRRHGLKLKSEWILPVPGVVPALTAIIKALTKPGDKVVFQTPAYNCFFTSVSKNRCENVYNPLIYKDNTYSIDFDDLEAKVSDPDTSLLILCNPHNPSGRVWSRDELIRVGEICLRHGVFVIADEIHCELTYGVRDYIPFASISEEFLMNSVTCTSPSKAFNIAGLEIANIFAAGAHTREKIVKALRDMELTGLNSFAPDALKAAYNNGEEWLEAVCGYIHENYIALKRFFSEYLPEYPVLPLEGTYLVWVNICASGKSSTELAEALLNEGKLMVNAGSMYGEDGNDFIRINIACPRKLLEEGLKRLKKVLKIQKN